MHARRRATTLTAFLCLAGSLALAATPPAGKPKPAAAKPRVAVPIAPPAPQPPPPPPVPLAPAVDVIIETSLGPITLRLDGEHAPVTAANFLAYVDAKRFDDSTVYRAVKIGEGNDYGMVQGGLRGNPKRMYKAIAHEATSATGLSHLDGAVSMARAEPGTATADFFLVVGNLTGLDATDTDPGYAVFGKVISGMEQVRAMLELPRSETAPVESMKGQWLAEPVKILRVRRAPVAEASPTTSPAP